jgi:hypothetical protein
MTLILLIALVTARPLAQGCVQYEPDVVTLTGTIKQHTLPGAPNYESVAKGDTPERVWVLHLARRICVAANADSEKEENVSDLQLVLPDGQKQYRRYRSLLGRRVSVSGTLFHAQTGHHHTKVLLTVSDIKR